MPSLLLGGGERGAGRSSELAGLSAEARRMRCRKCVQRGLPMLGSGGSGAGQGSAVTVGDIPSVRSRLRIFEIPDQIGNIRARCLRFTEYSFF